MLNRLLRGSWKDDVRAWAHVSNKACEYSPDLMDLECQLSNMLFVYGNMQRGHSRNNFLNKPDNLRVCPAFTLEPFTVMVKKLKDKSYPVPIRGNKPFHNYPPLPLRGELWSVPTETIRDLDTYYQNGNKDQGWNRVQVAIKIPFRKWGHLTRRTGPIDLQIANGTKMDLAYTYIGDRDYWLDRFNDMEYGKVTRLTPHIPVYKVDQYYWFTTQEYNE